MTNHLNSVVPILDLLGRKLEQRINELAAQIWGLTKKELKEI